jgi:hypothetical protein
VDEIYIQPGANCFRNRCRSFAESQKMSHAPVAAFIGSTNCAANSLSLLPEPTFRCDNVFMGVIGPLPVFPLQCHSGEVGPIVCVKYLQTFSLSTNNNVCQHCSCENRVFANIPSGERVYFCIT